MIKRIVPTLGLILALLVFSVPVGASEAAEAVSTSGTQQTLSVNSESAVLMDADTGEILYDKGMNEVHYPASITKLMTVLLAIENSSPDDSVTFTETGIRDVKSDSSNIGMQLGETMTMKDCWYAAIIQSANEVCAQIAETVGGTEEAFIDMMNQKAQELGCTNTHFANASGLPDENLYTTAYDMALILQAGLENETFRKVVGTVNYQIPATNLSAARTMHTHVPLLAQESGFYYEGCIAGKTGQTQAAGHTFAAAAERDGRTYIVVTMNATDLAINCTDAITLFDYGFSQPVSATPTPVPTDTPIPAPASDSAVTSSSAEEQTEAEQTAEETETASAVAEETAKGLSGTAKLLLAVMGVMVAVLIVLMIALHRKEKNS